MRREGLAVSVSVCVHYLGSHHYLLSQYHQIDIALYVDCIPLTTVKRAVVLIWRCGEFDR